MEKEGRLTARAELLRGVLVGTPFLFPLIVLNKPNTNSLWFDVQAKSRYGKGQRVEYAGPWLVLEFLWQA